MPGRWKLQEVTPISFLQQYSPAKPVFRRETLSVLGALGGLLILHVG